MNKSGILVSVMGVVIMSVISAQAVGIAAGDAHAFKICNNGTVWAWGDNGSGQLGIGTTADTNLPTQVSGFTDISDMAGGGSHSLALKNDGIVWAWGDNGNGQLGNGTTTSTNLPVQVIGLSEISAIAGGGGANGFSLALKNDGTVWAWGNNGNGQLGIGTTTSTNRPTQVSSLSGMTAVACGSQHSLALKDDGTVWAWGCNNYGQLGNGTTTSTNLPTLVNGITNAIAVAAGDRHSMAILSDGTIVSWGDNNRGQLGHSLMYYQIVPLAIFLEPTAPAGLVAGDGIYADKVPLAWNAVNNASTYSIWRSGANDTNTAAIIASGVAATNYDDTAAVPGVLYYYWIQAVNACGTSPLSSSASGWRLDISAGVCGDYDGDGKADPAIYDEVNGVWKIKLSGANYDYQLTTTLNGLGGRGYASVAADYDGDQKADPAVYTEITGRWLVMPSSADYAVVIAMSQALGGAGWTVSGRDK